MDSEGKKCENSQDLEKVVATVLVAHDSMSGCDFAHIVPQKGVDNDQYSVGVLVEDIKWLGFTRIILKSDNEPAIVKLLSDTLRELRYQIDDLEQAAEEHPNTYDSSGNADVEAAVKRVTGILRTNKIAFENKVNVSIPVNHPIISWMTEYAAWMCTTMRVGDDGMTPYHRVRGRPYTKRLVQFGECVLAQGDTKGPAAQERDKLDSRW